MRGQLAEDIAMSRLPDDIFSDEPSEDSGKIEPIWDQPCQEGVPYDAEGWDPEFVEKRIQEVSQQKAAAGFEVVREDEEQQQILVDVDGEPNSQYFGDEPGPSKKERWELWIEEKLRVVNSVLVEVDYAVTLKDFWVSKSGYGCHIVLETNAIMAWPERSVIASFFETDPLRELLTLRRHLAGCERSWLLFKPGE